MQNNQEETIREQGLKHLLISIVVPIYNVAPYLRECLDSLLVQTYPHFEVLMIDDGSTDESGSIAQEYLKDSRFSLTTTPNGGLSRARNEGIEQAKGEYLYFLDSDDYLHPDYLMEMIALAQEYQVEFLYNTQIVCFGLKTSPELPSSSPTLLAPNSQTIHLGGAVWRCLFTRDLVLRSGVRFLEGKVYEDEGFLYMILPFCSYFLSYRGKPYYYRQREGSIMCNYKKFRSYDLLDVFEAIFCFYEKNHWLERLRPPYYFLYQSGLGYENEKEYLQKAKEMAEKLGIQKEFLYLSKNHRYQKIKNKIKNILKRILGI